MRKTHKKEEDSDSDEITEDKTDKEIQGAAKCKMCTLTKL